MAINVRCTCGKKLRVENNFASKKIKCPSCGHGVAVPSLAEVDRAAVQAKQLAEEPASEPEASAQTRPPVKRTAARSPTWRRHWSWLAGAAAVALVVMVCAAFLVRSFFQGGESDNNLVENPTPADKPNAPGKDQHADAGRTRDDKRDHPKKEPKTPDGANPPKEEYPKKKEDLVQPVVPPSEPRLEVAIQMGHKAPITSVALSRNGSYIVTGSYPGPFRDGRVILWEAASGKQLLTFQWPGHLFEIDDRPIGAALSGDGKHLWTAYPDGTTRLCDLATGKERCRLYSFDAGKDWLVVTPDGGFDGSDGAWRFVAFREPGTLKLIDDDATRRRFHRPGLLADVWKGK